LGSLKVTDANLVDIQMADSFAADAQKPRRDEDDANKAYFATATRGDSSSIALTLSDIRRGARVELQLQQAVEFGSGPPIFRRHQKVPATEVELAVADVKRDGARAKISFGSYEDSIGLRRVVAGGPMEMAFEWRDENGLQGDNYYVRVTQLDGAMAWSSPIWVGGYASR
jgi:hypothetical protein